VDRERFWAEADAAFARLKADPEAWAAYERERKEFDGTAWEEWSLARIRELEAALRALVAVESTYTDYSYGRDVERCVFCEGGEERDPEQRFHYRFVHDPDCPWLRARVVLGGKGV
jgi:hypothetical protein